MAGKPKPPVDKKKPKRKPKPGPRRPAPRY